jgi:hypothetical protein
MTKRETIDRILQRNQSASPEFLAEFDADELRAYLRQLESLDIRPGRQIEADPEVRAPEHPVPSTGY